VRNVLAPTLALDEIFLEPRLIPTGPGGRGGALVYPRVLRYLRNTLRQRMDNYVATFFDLYALGSGFPGFAAGQAWADPLRRAGEIEQQFKVAVIAEAGVRAERFMPHIQPYEFEGLLFTDVGKLVGLEPEWSSLGDPLRTARARAASPEHINDGPNTHPSARLAQLRPAYRKTLHGPLVAEDIGLAALERECLHFAEWVQRLRALRPLG
jgi:hypothetical protein